MTLPIRVAAIAAALHITPVVVLVKRPEAAQALLPGVDAYFARVDTPHGPIEVAVGFTPQGTVRGVLVTKATVEMKPWVLEAVGAGLTNHYRQLKPGDSPNGAAAIAGQAGDLAEYIAGEVDKGVARALAAFGAFYRGSA